MYYINFFRTALFKTGIFEPVFLNQVFVLPVIEKPGFINLKFKKEFWSAFILDVLNKPSYGSNLKGKKNSFLVEFVSANPTGPLHVGHSRGAILGDVISNLLSFNGHNVTKEYYVNDYGNQISHFTKSVYFLSLIHI